MNFFEFLAAFLKYLPVVVQAVMSVETASKSLPVPLPSPAKKALVVGAIAAAGTQAGEPVPETHVHAVGNLTDVVVAALNATGVLKAVAPPAA